jgi:hypothetical protein
MKDKSEPPSDVLKLFKLKHSRSGPPSSAVIIDGLKLVRLFMRIESGFDRKKIIDLAKELAPIDADTST